MERDYQIQRQITSAAQVCYMSVFLRVLNLTRNKSGKATHPQVDLLKSLCCMNKRYLFSF